MNIINQHQHIGMVLSGGGVRGVAHAGALQALGEYGIRPTHISGSSAGAMVGALYAAGCTPKEILHFFKYKTKVLRWKCFARRKPGFMDIEKYEDLFLPYLKDCEFEELAISLNICVTDILKGEAKFFNRGNLIRLILASAAVPGVFTPVEIEGNWYIDGGTMNNFPIEPLLSECDYIIGSFVSPKKTLSRKDLSNSLKVLSRANGLAFIAGSTHKFEACDLFLAPQKLWKYGIFDTHKAEEIFQLGYRHTCTKLESMRQVNYFRKAS